MRSIIPFSRVTLLLVQLLNDNLQVLVLSSFYPHSYLQNVAMSNIIGIRHRCVLFLRHTLHCSRNCHPGRFRVMAANHQPSSHTCRYTIGSCLVNWQKTIPGTIPLSGLHSDLQRQEVNSTSSSSMYLRLTYISRGQHLCWNSRLILLS